MKIIKTEVLIIGGGLTGLTLAYLLQKVNIPFIVAEADKRIGGRINTKYNNNQAPIELGATWIIEQQTNILTLLKELNISVFEQYYNTTAIYEPNSSQPHQIVNLPSKNDSSYRIKGGSQNLIKELSKKIDTENYLLNTVIKNIEFINNELVSKSDNYTFHSKYTISTLPPALFFKSIITNPLLPLALKDIALKTHTWMGDSIRVGFTYKIAFWKNLKISSTIYSNKGPIQEFYDHSNAENTLQALSGFMNDSFNTYSKEERKNLALKQLESYYGPEALNYESYEECVWKDQQFTSTNNNSFIMQQQNNGHPIYQDSYLNDRLFIAGTETSNYFSGKMEGAINSAQTIFNKLERMYN